MKRKSNARSVPFGEGSMIAVLGMKTEDVINLLKIKKDKKEICEIANDNADGQIIISGKRKC